MSASVLKWLKEKRTQLRARAGVKPIALSTCDGSSEPVVQAEPVLTANPALSRLTTH